MRSKQPDLKSAMSDVVFHEIPYQGNTKNGPYSLYGIE
jgi:hypothetical protein